MKIYKEYVLKNGKLLIVRSATKNDADAELKMYKQQVLETPFLSRGESDTFPTSEDFAEGYEYFLNDNRACYVVAIYEGELIGSGHIDYCGNKKRFLHKCDVDLGVLKKCWGLGIGGKIMHTLIDVAKTSKFEQIELSVAAKNERAIKMYESFGFKTIGIFPNAVKYDDGSYDSYVSMIKFL